MRGRMKFFDLINTSKDPTCDDAMESTSFRFRIMENIDQI